MVRFPAETSLFSTVLKSAAANQPHIQSVLGTLCSEVQRPEPEANLSPPFFYIPSQHGRTTLSFTYYLLKDASTFLVQLSNDYLVKENSVPWCYMTGQSHLTAVLQTSSRSTKAYSGNASFPGTGETECNHKRQLVIGIFRLLQVLPWFKGTQGKCDR